MNLTIQQQVQSKLSLEHTNRFILVCTFVCKTIYMTIHPKTALFYCIFKPIFQNCHTILHIQPKWLPVHKIVKCGSCCRTGGIELCH